jgi:hypothetical protein
MVEWVSYKGYRGRNREAKTKLGAWNRRGTASLFPSGRFEEVESLSELLVGRKLKGRASLDSILPFIAEVSSDDIEIAKENRAFETMREELSGSRV